MIDVVDDADDCNDHVDCRYYLSITLKVMLAIVVFHTLMLTTILIDDYNYSND